MTSLTICKHLADADKATPTLKVQPTFAMFANAKKKKTCVNVA